MRRHRVLARTNSKALNTLAATEMIFRSKIALILSYLHSIGESREDAYREMMTCAMHGATRIGLREIGPFPSNMQLMALEVAEKAIGHEAAEVIAREIQEKESGQ